MSSLYPLMLLVASAERAEAVTACLAASFRSLAETLDAPASLLYRLKLTDAEISCIDAAREFVRTGRSIAQEADPVDLRKHWLSLIGGLPLEVAEVALMDASGSLLSGGLVRVESGTVERVTLHARRIMELAVGARAAGVVLAHNHPAGDASPTRLDIDTTRRIQLARINLDIRLVDHLIVTRENVFSFRDEGLL